MSSGDTSWVRNMMRWGQINFRELDPKTMDVKWWAEYMDRTKIDGLTINSGGLVAYYPTNIPHHRRSPVLGDGDLFGEVVAEAKKRGIRVVARLDVGKTGLEAFHSRPEWFCRTADGQVVRYLDSDLYFTCINGPYYYEFTADIMREVHSHYDVDGFFDNGWQSMPRTTGICHCPACVKKFRADTGLELPKKADWNDQTWNVWVQWRYKCLADTWGYLAKTTRECKPGTIYIGNLHRDFADLNSAGVDWLKLGELADMVEVDLQGRSERLQLWAPGELGRLMRECVDTPEGPKPYFDLFGQWYAGSPHWRVSTKPEAEQKLWIASFTASGMRPWWHIIGGDHSDADERWKSDHVIDDHFRWHYETDRYHRGLRTNAEVGLVYSPRTIDYYGQDDAHFRSVEPYRGWYYALMRARIPFDLVHERKLDADNLSQYRLLILANVACMTNEQIAQVKAFADRGGSVIATFETSLYDEWGKHREEFGLADLFGVRWKGAPIKPVDQVNDNFGHPRHTIVEHSYLRIRERHPILAGFEDTQILPFGAWILPTEAIDETAQPLGYIPPFIKLPPEQTYVRIPDTDLSMAILSEKGRSRRVYFPNDLDRVYWRLNLTDHMQLLGNTILWALGDDPMVKLEGPGILDVHSYDSPTGFQLRIANMTNPHLFRMPCDEIYPVGPLQVSVRLPQGKAASKARLLVSGQQLDVAMKDGRANMTIPKVEDLEIVVFE